MQEVCPICSDILSELNEMFETEQPLTMADLTWANIVFVRDALEAMYTAESVVHFITSWQRARNGGETTSHHGSPIVAQQSDQYQNWLDSLPRPSAENSDGDV